LFEVAVAPFSAFSDSLKRVQTALAIFDREAPTRRLGVVSAMSGEGKSTFLCNLAQLLAASGLRTVIVDADLRKPTLSRALASHAKHGLLDALRAPQEDLARFIAPTAFERVDLLPSVGEAPVASHDLLGSPATAQLLDRLAARYDFVLVDLPPLSLLPDGYAIGHLLDGMLLVARWNVAPMDTLREVAVGLRACGANTLGAVLTGVESLARRGYAPPYAPPASAA
jgi:capsular exopolysaccharide synthesis family protein